MKTLTSENKLLIIGLGGHSKAVLLPVITSTPVDVSVISRRPVDALNAAAIYKVKAASCLEEAVEECSHIIIATPPSEYPSLLKKIPLDKCVWIEKPVAEAGLSALECLRQLISCRTGAVFVGLLKRGILNHIPRAEIYNGYIQMPINQASGWRSIIPGGSLYADGIHAFDLAFTLLGPQSVMNIRNMSSSSWDIECASELGKIRIILGQTVPLISINGTEYTQMLTYRWSRLFFKQALASWLSGTSNFQSAFESHLIVTKLILGLSQNSE